MYVVPDGLILKELLKEYRRQLVNSNTPKDIVERNVAIIKDFFGRFKGKDK